MILIRLTNVGDYASCSRIRRRYLPAAELKKGKLSRLCNGCGPTNLYLRRPSPGPRGGQLHRIPAGNLVQPLANHPVLNGAVLIIILISIIILTPNMP
jgi:hypothetical protein